MEPDDKSKSQGKSLLLMGSSAYKAKELPAEIKKRVDNAINRNMRIIVAEAHGACRAFQDYLNGKGYRNVVVGHAKSIRYNSGNWPTKQYGLELKEREKRMIEACNEAAVIWVNSSGVIAYNLELLKRLGKPTYLYEYLTKTGKAKFGILDPTRVYNPHYYRAKYHRKRKRASS
jgi:hypothetical protein